MLPDRRSPSDPKALLTITQWCIVRNVSRSSFYKLKKQNKSPRTIELTPGDHRITPEFDQEWMAARIAEANKSLEAA